MESLKILLIVTLFILTTQLAHAQRLVSKLSVQEISINSTFTGGSLTLFGNVESQIGNHDKIIGPFDVIIVIQGTASNRIVREKSRQMGVWLNARHVDFLGVPAYFHILSTQPITNIISSEELRELGIGLETQIQSTRGQNEQIKDQFTGELVRLMTKAETYGVSSHAVSFLSDTFYNANLELPSDVPNGTYLATTFLFQDGALVGRRAERFLVRTVGMEKFISDAARDFPALYGIACVFLALFTGWLGGVAFKR